MKHNRSNSAGRRQRVPGDGLAYVICVRGIEENEFNNEPGKTLFLEVPRTAMPLPTHKIDKNLWLDAVLERAKLRSRSIAEENCSSGDIVVLIHGYANSQEIVMARHRQLQTDLDKLGWEGLVISFDWPSADNVLNYMEDRADAKATAITLVRDCVTEFAARQKVGCTINLHILAHSTGAYVVREAFAGADDNQTISRQNWMVSQIAFIGGDVSSACMSAGDARSRSMYNHCARLTNYWNGFDSVLAVSNAKRLGLAPRVGRIGLPYDVPEKAVDVDCSKYFDSRKEGKYPHHGSYDHSWHIGDRVWTKDFKMTIEGKIDRNWLPTRKKKADSDMELEKA